MAILSGAVKVSANTLKGGIETSEVNLSGSIRRGGGASFPSYEGPFEITPSQSSQVLPTQNTIVSENITINPIPSNYGLITYDGVSITVS